MYIRGGQMPAPNASHLCLNPTAKPNMTKEFVTRLAGQEAEFSKTPRRSLARLRFGFFEETELTS
jgi:hypothetical protein